MANIIEILVRASDQGASRTMQKIGQEGQQAADKIGQRLQRTGRGISRNFTLPFVAAGALATRELVQVENGIREVTTLLDTGGDVGDAAFNRIKAGIKDLSNEMGVAQDVLVGGLYQAISAGVPEDNAFEFMQVAAKAAIAGVTDTETAVDGLTTIINAFGLEAADAEKVADSMFATVQGGKTNFEQLSRSLFQAAPAAAAAGVSFQEVNAAIATLTAAGVPTRVAATQIRAALVGLQRPSKELDVIFQKLGFATAAQAIESEGLVFALDAVNDAAEGETGALMTLLGSVEAVGAAQVLAGTGAEKFTQEMERQEDSAGAVTIAFDKMEQSSARTFERTKVAVVNAAMSLAEVMLPVLEKVAGAIGTVANFFNKLPGPIKGVVVAFGTLVAIAGPLLSITGKLITGWGSMVGAMRGAGGASSNLGTGLRTLTRLAVNPLTLAVGLAVAGLIVWNSNKEKAKKRSEELKATLDKETGAITTQTRQVIANKVANFTSVGVLQRLGISTLEFTDAVMGNVEAQDRINERLMEAKVNGEILGVEYLLLSGTLSGMISDIERAEDAFRREAEAMGDTAGATDEATTRMEDHRAQLEAVWTATGDHATATDDATTVEEEFETAIKEVTGALALQDPALAEATSELGTFDQAVQDAITSEKEFSTVIKELADPVFGAIKANQRHAALVEELGDRTKWTADQTRQYIESVLETQAAFDRVDEGNMKASLIAVSKIMGVSEDAAHSLFREFLELSGLRIEPLINFRLAVPTGVIQVGSQRIAIAFQKGDRILMQEGGVALDDMDARLHGTEGVVPFNERGVDIMARVVERSLERLGVGVGGNGDGGDGVVNVFLDGELVARQQIRRSRRIGRRG